MTLQDELLRQLRDAAGAPAVDAATRIVTPGSADAAVAVVRACADTHTPLAVRSSTQSSATAPHDGVLVSLEKLNAVHAHAPGLTLTAGAGAEVDAVRAAAHRAKLAVVGLGAGPLLASVGSLVARGAVPRRSLTGVDAVLTTGETIRFGGASLKDVVGYDVPSLLLGSMGALAVVLSVTFRLEPAAAHTEAAPARGVVPPDPAIVRAFDPQGLLQSHS